MGQARLGVVTIVLALCLTPSANAGAHHPLTPMLVLADRVSQAQQKSSHEYHASFGLGSLLRMLNSTHAEHLADLLPDELEGRLLQASAASESQVEAAVHWAREYVHANADDLEGLLTCVAMNVSHVTGGCDMQDHMYSTLLGLLDDSGQLSRHTRAMPPPSRPVGYLYTNSPGIQTDLLRFGFWLSVAIMFVVRPSYLGLSIFHMVGRELTKLSLRSGLENMAAKTRHNLKKAEDEKWRTILSVFPTYHQFERAFKFNSPEEFSSTLSRLCSNSAFATGGEDSGNLLETCWADKRATLLESPAGMSHGLVFFGIPMVAEFLVSVFAALLFMTSNYTVRTCSADEIPENWMCSNGHYHGSVCVLQCKSTATTIGKIKWDKPVVRTCSDGVWFPEHVATCGSAAVADYDFGAKRHTA